MLLAAAINGDLAHLKEALEEGADVRAVAASGRTALHYAVVNRRADIACALLFAGAEVEAVDCFRRSALSLDQALHSEANHG